MRAAFPGLCACGCRRRYGAGAELVRGIGGWVLASCCLPTASRPGPGSPEEVLEVLRQARAVRDRVEAARRLF